MKKSKYLFIAWRYILPKGKRNITHFLSLITSFSIIACTVSILITLSAFNGIRALINYTIDENFPDLTLYPLQGKSIEVMDEDILTLHNLEEVDDVGVMIETKVLLENNSGQATCNMLGLDSNAYRILNYSSRIQSSFNYTPYFRKDIEHPFFLFSSDIAYALQYTKNDFFDNVKAYIQQQKVSKTYSLENHFFSYNISPEDFFYGVKELDNLSVLCNAYWLQKIVHLKKNNYSSLIISLKKGYSHQDKHIQTKISDVLNNTIKIKSKEDKNEITYKVLKSERLFILLLFGFILIIASFSFGGLISLVIIIKRNNFKILHAIGFKVKQIRYIFLLYSQLIVLISTIIGISISYFIIWLQIKYKLIKLSDNVFSIDHYPVILKKNDVFIVFFFIAVLYFLLCYLFVRKINFEKKLP